MFTEISAQVHERNNRWPFLNQLLANNFAPILGTVILEGLSEGLRTLLGILGIDVPGIKQVFFGIVLLLVVVALPEGVWPWLARRFRLTERKQ